MFGVLGGFGVEEDLMKLILMFKCSFREDLRNLGNDGVGEAFYL